ncbi:LysR family transcriptional regulator [Hymenobacter cellulosilyticus]|uniref:LysR substrate-binding domain-containing protein n=1 Tax=Hymenobacter cellulosilyticus TaxID=2932248 RepID=A0A8T9Q1J2_9BACT|nr:LysR substrate-binding domain-containing protein [Hymenobacter cellulosilyticus]UOQ71616.1 LysR substrate-binding domain-containing protein [Hymenobacter cellulosilyticus]
MNLDQIRYFLLLAEKRHFWQTAEQLELSQSSLSRHIQRLEAELGFPLFERTPRQVQLTAAGQLLRTEWQRLLTELDAVHRHARQVSSGEVGSLRIGHVGAAAYGWLPRLLARFTAQYPSVQLDLLEVSATESEHPLLTYQVDVGFWREPATNPALISEPVFAEQLALVVPQQHWAQAEGFTSLAALREELFVLPALTGPSAYVQTLRGLFAQYGFQPRGTVTSDFGSTMLHLVAAGLGVSVLPLSYASSPLPGLRFIELPHESAVYSVWRREDNSAVLQHLLAQAGALAPE